jgi:excisionase family DNA binding protein
MTKMVLLTEEELRALIREELKGVTPNETPNEILDRDEAAKMLAMHPKVLTRRARKGEIPALRLPGVKSWRFRRSELESWLKTEARRSA